MDGTPELYFGDPDGMVIQLQDTTYCGGAGALGNACCQSGAGTHEGTARRKGSQSLHDRGVDVARTVTFYQELFGLPVRSRQATTPGLGVGPGVMFVMFTGGAGAAAGARPPRPASINHVCMNMENFKPDDILKTLAGYGISAAR